MIVKKQNGELVEIKKSLAQPDLVLNSIDFDSMASNEKVVYAAMMAGLQRKTRSQSYVPEQEDVKMLKDLGEVRTKLEAREERQAANDALALLSDEEVTAKLEALHAKKLGSKDA